ncbi:MAG: hypothetical protein IJP48_06300 [Synergistaceae bacterium]|nr:hypothetical protein [Synergistaceae bacterium]
MKRSKIVTVIVICALCMSSVQPVFARTWGEFFTDTGTGAVLGVAAGGALAFFTGGAAIPFIVGGVAAGSAYGMADKKKNTWSEFFFGSEPEPSWCESYWYITAGVVIGAAAGCALAFFTSLGAVLCVTVGALTGGVVGAAPSDMREDMAKKALISAIGAVSAFFVGKLLGTAAGITAGVGTGAAGLALDR